MTTVETLAFYSYKGGVGRSLLLANAARFLAMLGKGVVVIDLDLEAPGMHYKLGQAPGADGQPRVPGGAVPYLLAASQGQRPGLEGHLVDVPVPPEAGGWLKLMPAGPAPRREYWTSLEQLGERQRLDEPGGEGLMALLDLHARIQDELKPDYILIDSRTGITEMGGLATTVLADTVVCLFVANQESIDGTLTVVEALTSAKRLQGQEPVRVVPVMARVVREPPFLTGGLRHGVREIMRLAEGHKGTWVSTRFVLPQDKVHGSVDRVVSGEQTANAWSVLTKHYLQLFAHLFTDLGDQADNVLRRLETMATVRRGLTAPIKPRPSSGHSGYKFTPGQAPKAPAAH
ncbi:MAG: ParA family protein, partial [Oligoflexia bacterium]|nr:ParA family protein [Oligoflexia bacterium]